MLPYYDRLLRSNTTELQLLIHSLPLHPPPVQLPPPSHDHAQCALFPIPAVAPQQNRFFHPHPPSPDVFAAIFSAPSPDSFAPPSAAHRPPPEPAPAAAKPQKPQKPPKPSAKQPKGTSIPPPNGTPFQNAANTNPRSNFTSPFRTASSLLPSKRKRSTAQSTSATDAANNNPASASIPEVPGVDPKLVSQIHSELLLSSPNVSWDDISGLSFAKRCVQEAIIWPMQRPDIFTGLRSPPRGLLLFGPPGTGKTLIGRAVASQSNAAFFNISASSLLSKWFGEGEKLVRALFAVASAMQPAVVFIDEIDSLLSARAGGEFEASMRVKTEFLVQMDGVAASRDDRVLVVGATNRPQMIDEAARRRMVKRLYIPLPDFEARVAMLKHVMRNEKHCIEDDGFERLARLTKGYSGSDLYALCAEAAMVGVRQLGGVEQMECDQVRPICETDVKEGMMVVRKSVGGGELNTYKEWNRMYGSFQQDEDKMEVQQQQQQPEKSTAVGQ